MFAPSLLGPGAVVAPLGVVVEVDEAFKGVRGQLAVAEAGLGVFEAFDQLGQDCFIVIYMLGGFLNPLLRKLRLLECVDLGDSVDLFLDREETGFQRAVEGGRHAVIKGRSLIAAQPVGQGANTIVVGG